MGLRIFEAQAAEHEQLAHLLEYSARSGVLVSVGLWTPKTFESVLEGF